ncbi:unnamed protein product, partial [Iphiclides podalirius]
MALIGYQSRPALRVRCGRTVDARTPRGRHIRRRGARDKVNRRNFARIFAVTAHAIQVDFEGIIIECNTE